VHTETIEYTVAGTRYLGFLAVERERAGTRPGVLLVPEGPGLGEVQRERARRLAGLGYTAFVVDYHGDGAVLSMEQMMPRLAALRAHPETIRAIGRAGLDVLTAQPETDRRKLAAIGHCYGGTAALELARDGAPLGCVVGFHAGLATIRPAEPGAIQAKILACIGADDPLVPPDQRLAFEAEMRAAKVADWRLYVYGNAVHGFANPAATGVGNPALAYHAPTDRRSWAEMLALFDETFR
jgi:dienelactone hydrolase